MKTTYMAKKAFFIRIIQDFFFYFNTFHQCTFPKVAPLVGVDVRGTLMFPSFLYIIAIFRLTYNTV